MNEAALMCVDYKLPDVTSMVVTKWSLDTGKPMPSDDSFVDGVWLLTGLEKSEVPSEQIRVREFDWKKVKTLGLS